MTQLKTQQNKSEKALNLKKNLFLKQMLNFSQINQKLQPILLFLGPLKKGINFQSHFKIINVWKEGGGRGRIIVFLVTVFAGH